jgi:hypothetical protein
MNRKDRDAIDRRLGIVRESESEAIDRRLQPSPLSWDGRVWRDINSVLDETGWAQYGDSRFEVRDGTFYPKPPVPFAVYMDFGKGRRRIDWLRVVVLVGIALGSAAFWGWVLMTVKP